MAPETIAKWEFRGLPRHYEWCPLAQKFGQAHGYRVVSTENLRQRLAAWASEQSGNRVTEIFPPRILDDRSPPRTIEPEVYPKYLERLVVQSSTQIHCSIAWSKDHGDERSHTPA